MSTAEEYPDPDEAPEVYDDSGSEDLVKSDEAEPREAAFMKGYNEESEGEMDDEKEDEEYLEAFEKAEEE